MSEQRKQYWRANLRLVATCLTIWFYISLNLLNQIDILLVDFLNQFQVGGYKLGFWFAQQGSIFTFLILIFWYAVRMNALDRKYGMREK